MIRFVLDPAGVVTPDLRRKLPGRGVWVSATADNVALAVNKNAFARGFKQAVTAPPSLSEDVARLMRAAALQRLAIAAKTGLVVLGFEKVRAAVKNGTAAVLVCASDAARDGREKLTALANAAGYRHNLSATFGQFSSEELEGVLGRERVVHVALAAGRPSDLFLADAARLHAYRTGAISGMEPANETDEPQQFAGPLTI